MLRKTFQSKKKKETQKRLLKRWIIGVAITLILLFVGGVIAANQSFARINNIVVTGQETLVAEDLTEIIQQILSVKTLWFFPHDTIFFYSKKKALARLFDNFSRLRHIQMRVENFDVLHVSITEHDPQYLWCGTGNESQQNQANVAVSDENDTSLNEGLEDVAAQGNIEETIEPPQKTLKKFVECYYMDNMSYIFSDAPYFSDHVFLKFIGSHNFIGDEPLRKQVFQPEAFKQILELIDLLKEINVSVNKISVEDNQDYILYVDTIDGERLGSESHILVNLRDPNNRIIENLKLAFQSESLMDRFRATPENLEYIDLRFEDKIVYRFEQSHGSDNTTTETTTSNQ